MSSPRLDEVEGEGQSPERNAGDPDEPLLVLENDPLFTLETESEDAPLVALDVDPSLTVDIGGINFPAEATPNLTLDVSTPQTVTIDISGVIGISGKQLKITVPQGLTIGGYPGIGGASLPALMQGSVTLDSGPALETTFTSTESLSARYGQVIYNFVDGYNGGQFTFQIGADSARLYAPHTVPNPLKIELTGGSGSLELNRVVTTEITAAGYTTSQLRYLKGLFNRSTGNSFSAFAALNQEVISARAGVYRSIVAVGDTYTKERRVLSLIYPANATLTGVVVDGTAANQPNGIVPNEELPKLYTGSGVPAGNTSITHDSTTRTVKFYYADNQYLSTSTASGLKLKFTSGTPGASYWVQAQVVATAYDGTDYTIGSPEDFYEFKLANTSAQRITLNADAKTWSVATTTLPGLTLLARAGFENATGMPITDQIVTYNFPRALNVRAFDAPSRTPGTNTYHVTVKPYDKPSYDLDISMPLENAERIQFTPTNLSLSAGDILEWATIEVGDFDAAYLFGQSSASGVRFYGNVAPGATGPFAIGVKVDSGADADGAYTDSVAITVDVAKNAWTMVNSITQKYGGYSYTVGDEIEVSATQSTYGGIANGTIQRTQNPDFYIVLPKDVNLKAGSINVSGAEGFSAGEPITFDDTGRRLIVVHTQGITGFMQDDLVAYPLFVLTFTMVPSDNIKTVSLNSSDLVYGGPTDGITLADASGTTTIKDTFDFNGNGYSTDDIKKPSVSTNYTIAADPAFNIFAEIGLPGGPYYTYDSASAAATTVPFTTISTAEYVLNIVNNLPGAAGSFYSYIPVPKNGKDYGAHFQSEVFKWSMGLAGAPAGVPADYTLTYTTDDIESVGYDSASYVDVSANLN